MPGHHDEPNPNPANPDLHRSILAQLLTATGETTAPSPVREGLPPSFRMRADRHYVEQLDVRPAPALPRLVPVGSIDVSGDLPEPDAALVAAIERHGILEPLLLREATPRYRLLSGRRRLAAALRVELEQVPAIVVPLSDDDANDIAATAHTAAAPPAARLDPLVDVATRAAANTLGVLESCRTLVGNAASPLATKVALELMQAEIWRSSCLMAAIRAVRGEVRASRAPATARSIVDRVVRETSVECRLRGIAEPLHGDAPGDVVRLDESLVVAGLSGLIATVFAWGGPSTPLRLGCGAAMLAGGGICFTVEQHGIEVPQTWIDRAFDSSWTDRPGGAPAMLWLLQAHRVAQAHGGHAAVHRLSGGSSMTMTIAAR